jgi:uncharacterized membrane protein
MNKEKNFIIMKKICVSFLMAAVVMAMAIGMAPVSVSAHSNSHSSGTAGTSSSKTKKCSSYKDKNHDKKCDSCGKKKTSHHNSSHH